MFLKAIQALPPAARDFTFQGVTYPLPLSYAVDTAIPGEVILTSRHSDRTQIILDTDVTPELLYSLQVGTHPKLCMKDTLRLVDKGYQVFETGQLIHVGCDIKRYNRTYTIGSLACASDNRWYFLSIDVGQSVVEDGDITLNEVNELQYLHYFDWWYPVTEDGRPTTTPGSIRVKKFT
jgi:hypothetical protein